MNLEQFADRARVTEMTEVERVCHLAFFDLQVNGTAEFGLPDVRRWLEALHLPTPNLSRLGNNLIASKAVIRGASNTVYKLHRSEISSLASLFPDLKATNQDVVSEGKVLPSILYENTRGYIESLAKQVNASYENNIFDGCAVLIRRFEEVLLILSYEKLGVSQDIRGVDGNYLMLEGIVSNAVGNPRLSLSRTSKTSIEVFRKLGNYSAHKITYTCKREYIAEKIDDLRALIDELLHKAGLRT